MPSVSIRGSVTLNYQLVMCLIVLLSVTGPVIQAQDNCESVAEPSSLRSLEEIRIEGALQSAYRKQRPRQVQTTVPQADLAGFQQHVRPILQKHCMHCHGPDLKEGNMRLDTLNPDLLHGNDVKWWLEVLAVLSNGEMPPADETELPEKDRSQLVEWLSSQVQVASIVRRSERGHSSFRRMTRYEYNYALQDLLGLPLEFAKDLHPESRSEDGFHNSSETLQMSATQLAVYREAGRNALLRATARGEQPTPLYWSIPPQAAAAEEWAKQEEQLEKIKQKHQDDPEKLAQELERLTKSFQGRPNNAYYQHLPTGRTVAAKWRYPGARYAWKPTVTRPAVPARSDYVAVIPRGKRWIVELGDRIPEAGNLRVRVRASRTSSGDKQIPSLQLDFGWQASNDSHASVRISRQDIPIEAGPDDPAFYEWEIPLGDIYPRNSVRKISKLGDLPSPSEYVRFVNSSISQGDIQIDYVEITAPVYDQWPPASHHRIFIESKNKDDETVYAREVLTRLMERAWRRTVTPAEVEQKLALFKTIRPACEDFQEAMIEVLATVLSSPKFLYLAWPEQPESSKKPGAKSQLPDSALATRLAVFLWCSVPDEELLELAAAGRLSDSGVLQAQVERMLADPRARRFSEHFTRQWLGMQLLDYLNVDRKVYPQFDPGLKEAMQAEPVAFFHEVLRNNHSVLDLIHANYTMVNERLARHYGLADVYGNDFRRVKLEAQHSRGGLLTQAGLLAMNSDGKDSHPLKRGIWLLESLLNDPPPPPPPAVPEIDLADPEIAKLTLKQRIENHRNQAACLSCHAKIDPWGIAFENFDALGSWRTQVNGKPVDSTSRLFNKQKLDGMDGLKRYLLANRQDQFARAMVHKMTSFALGRPLSFSDRSRLEQITAEFRKQGDGLATLVTLIVTSDLFQSR